MKVWPYDVELQPEVTYLWKCLQLNDTKLAARVLKHAEEAGEIQLAHVDYQMSESKETVLHKLIYLDVTQKTCAGITSEAIREQLIDFLMNDCKAATTKKDKLENTPFDAARMITA